MKRIDNEDGTWYIIFDTAGEALDDCEIGKYGDSEIFTRVRNEVKYVITFITKEGNHTRALKPVITYKKPRLRENIMFYTVEDKNGEEVTVGYSLRNEGVAFTSYKLTTPILRRIVASERHDPSGSVRYLYKKGDSVQEGYDL